MEENKYDLILKNGKVIDPHQGIHGQMDIAVRDGRIAMLRERITGDAEQVIDVKDKLVLPGLIDLHTHIYWGGTSIAIQPEPITSQSGVCTWVDAGSAGAGNFPGFEKQIRETTDLQIFAFLNIAFAGIFGYIPQKGKDVEDLWIGELQDIRLANEEAALRTANQYPDTIVGIKVRAGLGGCDHPGMEPVLRAKSVADEIGKPLMVHVSHPPPEVSVILSVLGRGDVLTHAFRDPPNCLLDTKGAMIPQLVKARDRGVILDVGHGCGSFSFKTTRRLLEQGVAPDTISSDLHQGSIDGPAYDLPTTMSKLLSLGMELDDVVAAATRTPAKVIGQEMHIGSLTPGMSANISVMEVLKDGYLFQDCFNNQIMGEKRLVACFTIVNGLTPGS